MIKFDELPHLAVDFMNKDHQLAAELVNDVEKYYELGDVSAVEKNLGLLQIHCKEHFAHEEQEMKAHSFPPYQVHKQEHDRVLMELDMIIKQLNNHKDLARVAGYLKNEFPTWCAQQLATMDRRTAQFISAQTVS